MAGRLRWLLCLHEGLPNLLQLEFRPHLAVSELVTFLLRELAMRLFGPIRRCAIVEAGATTHQLPSLYDKQVLG